MSTDTMEETETDETPVQPLVVSVVGPESSGTRLMVALLEDLGVNEVVHRSVPYGRDWWPDRGDADADAYVLITRDREKTLASQKRAGHLNYWSPRLSPDEKYDCAMGVIVRHLYVEGTLRSNVFHVQYEDLVDYPQGVMDLLADRLGVERKPVTREIDTDR